MKALVLAGGSGTRFWPASRRRLPKQFLTIAGESSLLQLAVERLAPLIAAESVWVSTTRDLAAAVGHQLPSVPPHQILAEPLPRNTLPAIAWCISRMPESVRREVIAVMPSDHWLVDAETFRATLRRAAEAAADGRILTLGVIPTRAESGYGYLEVARQPRDDTPERVVRFTEKPDSSTAEEFVASGRHLWNAGIFVFRGVDFQRLLERYRPDLAAAVARLAQDEESLAAGYGELASESIDTGLMERLDEIHTLPLSGWNDLGSWRALADVLAADANGNRSRGDVMAVDARDNVVYAAGGTVALLGVDGLAVVRTDDAVLVIPKERAQEVRRLVEELERSRREDLL